MVARLVLCGLTCSYAYFDDVLVASKDEDEHLSHLLQVLTCLQGYGIQLNAAASLLCHIQLDVSTCIIVDVSDHAVGAMLEQQIDSVWCRISYVLQKLCPAEKKYSSFEQGIVSRLPCHPTLPTLCGK